MLAHSLITIRTYSQSSPLQAGRPCSKASPTLFTAAVCWEYRRAAYRPFSLAGPLANIISFHSCLVRIFSVPQSHKSNTQIDFLGWIDVQQVETLNKMNIYL